MHNIERETIASSGKKIHAKQRRKADGAQKLAHSSEEEEENPLCKKKDKKLVFLSKSVLRKVREKPMTTGTQVRLFSGLN